LCYNYFSMPKRVYLDVFVPIFSICFFAVILVGSSNAGCWRTTAPRDECCYKEKCTVWLDGTSSGTACYNGPCSTNPKSMGSTEHNWRCDFNNCSGTPKPPKPNNPPTCTVNTGPDTTTTPLYAGDQNFYPLTATATDSDGSIAKYAWTDAIGGTFNPANTKDTSWRPGPVLGGNPTPLRLTVTDNKGATGACTWPVRVIPGYTLTLKAWLKDASSSVCTTNSPLITNQIPNFNVYNASNNALLGGGKTDAAGSFKVQISRLIKDLRVFSSYNPPNTCTGFEPVCAPSTISSNFYTTTVNVPDDFTNPSDQYVGFQELKKQGWVTAIDGNIEARLIGGNLPCNNMVVSGNFNSTMINLTGAYSATSTKGYIFSKDPVATAVTSLKLIEDQVRRGGWAFKTAGSDAYLGVFSFKVPSNSEVTAITNLSPSPTLSRPATSKLFGRAYKINVEDFNDVTALGTGVYYRFMVRSGPGWITVPMPLVYIEGNDGDEVVINAPILSVYPPNLLIVTDLPVRITKNVGTAYVPLTGYSGYTETAVPNIQAAILSSKTITVERDDTVDPGVTPDKAIMLQGPFVSLANLRFNRDAGYHNDEFPPQAVKYNPVYLYYLTQLERTNPMFKSYTGIGVYDIQWVYPD
jgi:hypothetical protein